MTTISLSESTQEKIISYTPLIILVIIGLLLGLIDSIKNRNAPPTPEPELSDVELLLRFYDTQPSFLEFLMELLGLAGLMLLALSAGATIRQVIIG